MDDERNEARCICAKADYDEGQIVAKDELEPFEYSEIPLEVKPTVRVECAVSRI
ncbi:putative formate acetyltransferase withPFL-like glycyl radical domain (fragment) [Xenorhabdus nematophila ATCC 19061]|uniref:Formate acetyltransferase withPFL-like glycyl radical domain n=1 Tax=Xenorhabdus nematophila (strain ATCC 19061 / DSM 3370 / CCUG 14189 / LMG 1036 / NCIMB 9965 / AN6) TaxID=406817 RepID=D3VLH9_XENNA